MNEADLLTRISVNPAIFGGLKRVVASRQHAASHPGGWFRPPPAVLPCNFFSYFLPRRTHGCDLG